MTLPNKYNEIMSRVTVTSDMHERIIDNIRRADLDPKGYRLQQLFRHNKRAMSIAVCFLLLLTGAFVTTQNLHQSETVQPIEQVPGPVLGVPYITEYPSVQELATGIGFEVKEVTQIPFQVRQTDYSSVSGEMAQIHYSGADNSLMFRMSPGNNDISGDYKQYNDTKTISLKDERVTIKGNGGKYELAIWQSNGFSYCLSTEKGISEKDLMLTVQSVQ